MVSTQRTSESSADRYHRKKCRPTWSLMKKRTTRLAGICNGVLMGSFFFIFSHLLMSLCIYFFTLTALLTHIAFGSSIHLQREDVSIIPVYNGVSFDLWVDQTHYHALLHPWNDLLHSSHNIDTLGESVSRNTSFNTYRGDTIEYHITATLLTDGLVSAMIIPRNKGTGNIANLPLY